MQQKYPEWESNPHGHFWPQDFKSCVSTSSTIRANPKPEKSKATSGSQIYKEEKNCLRRQGAFLPVSKVKKPPLWAAFRAGNGTRTRDPNLGKVVLYQLSYSRLIFQISLDLSDPPDLHRDALSTEQLIVIIFN